MDKSAAVTFVSPYFQVEPDEDSKTNPEIFGRALADWIVAKLRETGIVTKALVPEDWGSSIVRTSNA